MYDKPYRIKHPKTGDVAHTVIYGLIQAVQTRNAVLAEDGETVDPAKLRPVARLGGGMYATLGMGFELKRLLWESVKERVSSMFR